MSDAVTTEAEMILQLPPPAARIRLSTVLDRAGREAPGSAAHGLALSFNAHLCTKIRELAEQRHVMTPWAK